MDVLIIGSILRGVIAGIAGAAGNEQVTEWNGYLGLLANLLSLKNNVSAELQLLDAQIKDAVANNRGLLPEQRMMWKAYSDAASARIAEIAAEIRAGE